MKIYSIKSTYWCIFTIICLISHFLIMQPYYSILVFCKGTSNNDFFHALSTQFLHLNVFHLLVNVIALKVVVERFKNRKILKLSLIMTISIVGIAILLLIFGNKNVEYIGFSGVIFSLYGYQSLQSLKSQTEKKELFSDLLGMIGITIVFPNVSWLLHFSGLCIGIVVAIIKKCRYKFWCN